MADISVIIPSNHAQIDLLRAVRSVCDQTIQPAEIIIVDSYISEVICVDELSILCSLKNINLIYIRRSLSLPGSARNIGFEKSTSTFIAFIDVQTIPRPYWLETYLKLFENKSILGIWGATSFQAETILE